MSNDEDELNARGERTGRFVSRAPTYRVGEVSSLSNHQLCYNINNTWQINEMLTEIDNSTDPIPSTCYTACIQGDPIEVAPKVSAKLVNWTRHWMIHTEWFMEGQNNKFDVPNHVAESGKAWGEEEDPEELEKKAQQFKEEKKAVVQESKARTMKKQRQRLDGESSKVKKQVEKVKAKEVKCTAKETTKKAEDTKMDSDSNIDLILRGAKLGSAGMSRVDGSSDIDMDSDSFWG